MISRSSSVMSRANEGRGALSRKTKVLMRLDSTNPPSIVEPARALEAVGRFVRHSVPAQAGSEGADVRGSEDRFGEAPYAIEDLGGSIVLHASQRFSPVVHVHGGDHHCER